MQTPFVYSFNIFLDFCTVLRDICLILSILSFIIAEDDVEDVFFKY